jgi:hypothetical protein
MKFSSSIALSAGVALALFSLDANSQVVYRCGNAYSQVPCEDGKIVEATDPRSGAQRAEAKRAVEGERRLADNMRRDRLADQVKPVAASSLSGAYPPVAKHEPVTPTHHAKNKRSSSKALISDDFTAFDPSSRKKGSKKK